MMLDDTKFRKCANCGLITTIKNKKSKNSFCNKICHDEYQNKKISVVCLNCRKEFNISHVKAENSKKFCSRKCDLEYKTRPNTIIKVDDNISKIQIESKKGIKYVIIDNFNIDKVNKLRWWIVGRNNLVYARTNINGKETSLHRFILDMHDDNLVVDHINRNTLDNRISNLRVCTRLVNAHNRNVSINSVTGYTGVYKTKEENFIARIFFKKKIIHLGTFSTIEEAIEARKEANNKLWETELCNYVYLK